MGLSNVFVPVLEGVYPGVALPARALETPVRPLSALAPHAFVCRVGKTRALFRNGACKAELTEFEAVGNRAFTVALECRKPRPVARFMDELADPLPPNIDDGTWLCRCVAGQL